MSISAQSVSTEAGVKGVAFGAGSQRGTLLSRVRSLRSVRQAFEKVARNRKSVGGVDEISVKAFEADKEALLRAISRQLRDGEYRFSRLRPVAVPKKAKDDYRPILVPTVSDRIVQRAILHQISRYVGPLIDHRSSHAFRADVGVKSAVMQLASELRRGKRVVLIVDIENFFGTIDGHILFDELLEILPDRSIAPLLRQLQNWELNDLSALPLYKRGCFPQAGMGVPQGSALSPILSNFFLRGLDAEAAAKGILAIRYADDIAVACDSVAEAHQVFSWLQDHLQSRGLTIHPIGHDKTKLIEIGVGGTTGVEYLGFFLSPEGHDVTVSIGNPSFTKAKTTVSDCFDPKSAVTLADRYSKLTYFLNSWLGTYGYVCPTDAERAQLLDCAQAGLNKLLVQRGLLQNGKGLSQDQRSFLGIDSIFQRAERRGRQVRSTSRVRRR